MALSDAIRRFKEPGVMPLKIFIGGDGQSFERLLQITTGTPGVPEPLSGITVTAEIRDPVDNLVVAITCTVTDAVNGWIKLSLTRAAADAISWPAGALVSGAKALRGRWHLRLDDGTASIPVVAGPVEVLR